MNIGQKRSSGAGKLPEEAKLESPTRGAGEARNALESEDDV